MINAIILPKIVNSGKQENCFCFCEMFKTADHFYSFQRLTEMDRHSHRAMIYCSFYIRPVVVEFIKLH